MSERPRHRALCVSAAVALVAGLAAAAFGAWGCVGEGQLNCLDRRCPTGPAAEWPDLGGIHPPTDSGGTPRQDAGRDSGSAPTDTGSSVEDLGSQDPPDLGTGCLDQPWPRASRLGVDSSGGSGGSADGGEIVVDGRSVLVFVPPCDVRSPVWGLVIALHDGDGDREYLAHKWSIAAAQRGYIVALPQAARAYAAPRNWLENTEDNLALVRATVPALEERYPIDRNDTVLTGLGAGATFANDVAVSDGEAELDGDDATHALFEKLWLVNGNLWDPSIQQRGVATFIVLGVSDNSYLGRLDPSDLFRYLYVPTLEGYYPGPLDPDKEGDRWVRDIDPTGAIDWFWP